MASSWFIILVFLGITSANNMTRSYKGFWCDYNFQCLKIIGDNSLCLANECQCNPHYHINYETKCVRDKGLKEPCVTDDECYWGPEMVNKLECNLGVCDCVHGYVPSSGRICVKYFENSGNKFAPFFSYLLMATIGLYFVK